MKKVLIIALLSVLLASCGNKTEVKKETQKEKNVEIQEQNFKDLTKYIKTDITDQESDKLVKILELRIEKQAEIKKLIENSTKDTSIETYEKIRKIRDEYTQAILPFVDKIKVSSFKKYFERINFAIKKKLDEL